jgi:ribonuclease PH
MRLDGRQKNELRPVSICPDVSPYAEGSAEISYGKTKVLITASVESEMPRWKSPGEGGWITAEYGMLPRSTHDRMRREASAGKQSSRTQEIQRLIGRSLRAAVDLKEIEGLTIKLDCDVIVADGGTRTASITGAWVALSRALQWAAVQGLVKKDIELRQIAAVSLGFVEGESLVDLCYEEDSNADVDLNLVFNDSSELIEIQGTGEKSGLSLPQLSELLELGNTAAQQLFAIQRQAVESTGDK